MRNVLYSYIKVFVLFFFFFKASDYCLSFMIKTQIVRALYLGRYYSFWEAFSRVKILKPNLKYFHKQK